MRRQRRPVRFMVSLARLSQVGTGKADKRKPKGRSVLQQGALLLTLSSFLGLRALAGCPLSGVRRSR